MVNFVETAYKNAFFYDIAQHDFNSLKRLYFEQHYAKTVYNVNETVLKRRKNCFFSLSKSQS